MNQSFTSKVTSFLGAKPETVDDIIATFDATRLKLVAKAQELRDNAAVEEAEAVRLSALATAKQAEAERAITIADRFAALTA